MNKLYRVLVLLVLFGLGIQCASAANVTFDPQTVQMRMSPSQNSSTIQIVMDELPDGLTGFNITVSVSDPEIAEITAVSFPSWISLPYNSPVPSSSVYITGIDLNDQVNPGATNVLLGNITITGKKAGTADLNISTGSFYDPDGSFNDHIYPDSIPVQINVLDISLPVANFTADPTSGDAPLSVQFNDSSENATSLSWDFENDGVSDSNESNPVHVFTAAGTYAVNLTAINSDGTNSTSATITVNEPVPPEQPVLPVAKFTANPINGDAPLSVQFNDSSENATSLSWDFDNNGVSDSNESNPVYVFTTAGIYNVNLTVSNGDGTNSTSATITVNEPVPPEQPVLPVANFTADLTVQFTDTSANSPTSWLWDFGDGTNSTEQNPEHVYSSEGTYNVTLVATNGAGSSEVKSMVVGLNHGTTNSVPTSPVANFAANTTEGTAPLTVKFTDASNNNPTGWYWNFGDETNSTEQNPVHTYSAAGNYPVNLTARNGAGSSGVKSMNIAVTAPTYASPTARFIVLPQFGRIPLTVKFTDKSVNAKSVKWDFGDGATSTERSPSHTYTTRGFYTAKLTAMNGDKSSIASHIIYAAS